MSTPRKYRKKNAIVEAVQWLGPRNDAMDRLAEWGARVEPSSNGWDAPHWPIWLETLAGKANVFVGDWIVKGNLPNDFYPIRANLFHSLFDLEESHVDRAANG